MAHHILLDSLDDPPDSGLTLAFAAGNVHVVAEPGTDNDEGASADATLSGSDLLYFAVGYTHADFDADAWYRGGAAVGDSDGPPIGVCLAGFTDPRLDASVSHALRDGTEGGGE